MKFFLRLSTRGVALGLAACSTPTPVGIKPSDVPAAYTSPITPDAKAWPTPDWWKMFTSPELAGFEDTARTDNLDLAAAAARVLEAQAQTGITVSELFPELGATANASRSGGPKLPSPPCTVNCSNTGNSFGASI